MQASYRSRSPNKFFARNGFQERAHTCDILLTTTCLQCKTQIGKVLVRQSEISLIVYLRRQLVFGEYLCHCFSLRRLRSSFIPSIVAPNTARQITPARSRNPKSIVINATSKETKMIRIEAIVVLSFIIVSYL